MPYVSHIGVSQAVFTPANTSHVANDVVGGAKEFKNLSPNAGQGGLIISASLLIATPTLFTTTWRLHLFDVTPPSAVADDGAYTFPTGDLASFIGSVDIAQAVDLVDNLYIQSDNLNKAIKLRGYSAFGYLVNLATVTTPAVAHTVTLHMMSM